MKKSHAEIEREEERTGIDLDRDDEKGESKAHKAKMRRHGWKRFKEWLQLREDGGLMGVPGTAFPDGQKPSDNMINQSPGCSGGPCPKKGGGMAGPAGAAPTPAPGPKKQRKQ